MVKRDVLSSTNIPNCVLWLDSTDETTMTLYGGVYLQQWRDKISSLQFDYYYGSPVLYRNVSNNQSAFLFSATQSIGGSSHADPSLTSIDYANGSTGGGSAGNEASPYWQSPYGRANQNGLVVLKY